VLERGHRAIARGGGVTISGIPRFVGSVKTQTPTQLAEAAIETIGELRRYGKNKKPLAYEVGLDMAGRLVVDRIGCTPRAEWLMNCTRTSDPDLLADEIRAELESRNA